MTYIFYRPEPIKGKLDKILNFQYITYSIGGYPIGGNKMKLLKIALLISIFATSCLYVYSDTRDKGYGPGYHRGYGYCFEESDQLSKDLNLTEKQEQEIEKINKDYRDKYDKNRGDRDAMWKLHDEHDKAILAVLTKEQKEKLDKLPKNRRYRGKRRGFHRGFGGGGCW